MYESTIDAWIKSEDARRIDCTVDVDVDVCYSTYFFVVDAPNCDIIIVLHCAGIAQVLLVTHNLSLRHIAVLQSLANVFYTGKLFRQIFTYESSVLVC